MTLSSVPKPPGEQRSGKSIVLVSCVSKKRNIRGPAEDMYCSAWFQKARHYAHAFGDRWFILSVKYGLVHPRATIEPYNESLKTIRVIERRLWTSKVVTTLSTELTPADRVVMLAGVTYRRDLVPMIQALDVQVEIPLEGKRIGEQLG